MIIRKTLVSVCAVAAVLALGACSSDDSSDSSATTSAATSSATTSLSTSSATTSAAAAADAPTADQLNADLVALIDPAKPIDEKTALVVDGSARQANIETMGTALGSNPAYKISFTVENVKVDGQTATADVVVVSPHGSMPAAPWTWELEDGSWKLADSSACVLLEMGRAPCA